MVRSHPIQQVYEAEILTRAEYERKRKALLATARTPVVPGAINEARAFALLADMPALIDAATPNERQAVVDALFEKVWVQGKGIVAVTPRADVGPILAGLARVRYGCLDGVPDGFRTRNLLSHSQALCH
jgi:hypothetical protein